MIEYRALAHIPRDIGDGDQQAPAARVFRCRIGRGENRVIEITCVFAVDGDQRHVAQVLAPIEGDRAGGVGFLFRALGEGDGDIAAPLRLRARTA
jgi:hypothetical protein